MRHVIPLMKHLALAALALAGIAAGGSAGAVAGMALAYLLLAPGAVIAATLFSSAHLDPMSVWFPVMENCATMGFAAGGVIATFLISCRYRAMPERLQ
jgi:hypothetical protein